MQESARRVGAISVVHETLAQSAEDDTEFTEIVGLLVKLVEETVSLPERPLRFSVIGEGGKFITLPWQCNYRYKTVDHGYPESLMVTEGNLGGNYRN